MCEIVPFRIRSIASSKAAIVATHRPALVAVWWRNPVTCKLEARWIAEEPEDESWPPCRCHAA